VQEVELVEEDLDVAKVTEKDLVASTASSSGGWYCLRVTLKLCRFGRQTRLLPMEEGARWRVFQRVRSCRASALKGRRS
jgi:hypothetical protein